MWFVIVYCILFVLYYSVDLINFGFIVKWVVLGEKSVLLNSFG